MMAILGAVVAWSLRNRALVVFATVLFALVGLRSAASLTVDAVPDITNVQVQVITSAPALSPVEVEQYVTIPVERAMAGVPRAAEIRSLSKYGISVVTVVFEDGTDIYFARQLVGERMRRAQDAVPSHYGKPDMGPISSGLGEIFQFVVRNPRLDVMATTEVLEYQIGPQLRTVPGVVEVNDFGGEARQYQVVLDPKRLQALGVSVAEVGEALRRTNANAGGGYVEHDRQHYVRPKGAHRDTWIVRKVQALYTPVLDLALRRRLATMSIAFGLLALGAFVLSRLGAEFVPQLDEGDVLVEVRRLPGIALSESVATDARIQKALLTIPEITHVVCKTGAPGIATDPMGIEQTDVYISLRDRADWRRGRTKALLSKDIEAALASAVPEVAGGISQPIQMRTNELVAGIRSDVAAIVYGDDLDELARLGERIAAKVRTVPGAVDVRVEQVAGLEYLRIVPDRQKLARYGLTVDDVNVLTETLSVGWEVGHMLDRERRFPIVVRTGRGYTRDLGPIEALPLRDPNGLMVPLGSVADVAFESGPASVNREHQARRLVVELNVRGRDLLSVVEEARRKIAEAVPMPPGYRLEWGGQFEHYTEARARLAIAVPLALVLILFLLWLAFQSMRSALLIFSGVPFAVVGGGLALFVRGMPFSISAGVGFIALSGVAVLNGLVLVSFSRSLEAVGRSHHEAIREAAELRLRPVLMTAIVAALGFVPMAFSTAPGSEIQRPLATVVLGGIVTATALTMLVLPVVYAYFGAEPVRGGAGSNGNGGSR